MASRNVLRTSRLITQSHTKRVVAAAITAAKARNDWSNSDAADALGCCESTIRNRLDEDAPNNQMTVHELLRSIQSDQGKIANDIIRELGFRLEPIDPLPDATCDRSKHSHLLRAALDLSIALEDGELSDEEIRANRKSLETAGDAIAALLSRVGPKGARA